MKRKANGEGSLYYSNTKQRLIIQYIDPITHKQKKIVQKKNETDKDFRAKYYKLITEINENKYSASSKTTISNIITEQIESLHKANKIKDISYLRRKATLKIISKMDIANVPIQRITNRQINNDLTSITNYANSTISKICSMLSSAYDYAVAYNIVQQNPFRIKNLIIKPKSVKPTKKVEALTVEEQKAFEKELQKTNDEYKTIFYILLYTRYACWRSISFNR